MPKKGGGGAHDDEEKAEERLQAVVIATAFELGNAWAPLSLDTPPALFPLATVPLIDYVRASLSWSHGARIPWSRGRGAREEPLSALLIAWHGH